MLQLSVVYEGLYIGYIYLFIYIISSLERKSIHKLLIGISTDIKWFLIVFINRILDIILQFIVILDQFTVKLKILGLYCKIGVFRK